MIIRLIAVSRINPAPYNPRKDHKPDDREYQQLVRSLDEFGFVEPLLLRLMSCDMITWL